MRRVSLLAFISLQALQTFAASTMREQVSQASNDFGLRVFAEVASVKLKESNNAFFSPFSASQAFSLLYNGSHGQTQEDMKKAIYGGNLNPQDVNAGNQAILASFKDQSDFTLHIANAVFAHNDFQLKASFASDVKSAYQAEISTLNFRSPSSSKAINDWASKNTQGKIPRIITPETLAQMESLIANATYFKASWDHPFDPQATGEEAFTVQSGQTKNVSFMHQAQKYRYTRQSDYEAIEIPYKGSRMSMIVALPTNENGLPALEALLKNSDEQFVTSLAKTLEETTPLFGTLMLPKFQFSQEHQLLEAMDAVGLSSLFFRPDFSNMVSKGDFAVGSAKQNVFIQVDEKGTEAAAVTTIGIVATSVLENKPKFDMRVNRPFLTYILDRSTGTLLFVGAIVSP